jgi:hypothetical protein
MGGDVNQQTTKVQTRVGFRDGQELHFSALQRHQTALRQHLLLFGLRRHSAAGAGRRARPQLKQQVTDHIQQYTDRNEDESGHSEAVVAEAELSQNSVAVVYGARLARRVGALDETVVCSEYRNGQTSIHK